MMDSAQPSNYRCFQRPSSKWHLDVGLSANSLVIEDVGQEGDQAELLGWRVRVAQALDLKCVLVNELLCLLTGAPISVNQLITV